MTFVGDLPAPGAPAASDAPAPGKLTAAAWALYQAGRAEVAAKNSALTALSVARQRAEIDAERSPLMQQARRKLAAELSASNASVRDIRAAARKWAAEHADAADRLAEYQAQARAKAEIGE